jgi:hypothetical protein
MLDSRLRGNDVERRWIPAFAGVTATTLDSRLRGNDTNLLETAVFAGLSGDDADAGTVYCIVIAS